MARSLSVLYFTNSLVRGGAEEHVLTLLRGLDRDRFRAHLVCTPEVERALRPDLPADVEVTPLRLRRPAHVAAAVALARRLRARRIDILHSHLFYASLFASPVGWLCRVPVIIETPHLREHWRRGWLKGRFTVDRFIGRFVQRYIAVSEANARYLTEQKRLPARKITVIHNGCDIERFDPARRPPPGLRLELGFAAEDPVLLVLGRLEPQKGHRILLDAMPEVHRRFPRARLVCAGDGTLRGELEAQARSLGLAQVVRFVGYQPDVTPWLALADISVLPSFYEGLPLAAVESLAAGRPVVATAVDGTPEVVVDGETGLLVSPGDPAGLANGLCRLLGDPAGRARLGRAGRARAMDLFDQRQQVRRTQELYTAAQAGVHGTLPAIAGAGAGHGPRIP